MRMGSAAPAGAIATMSPTRLADASAMIGLAERRGRILQIGHLERFNAAVLALGDVIDRPLFIESHRIAPF